MLFGEYNREIDIAVNRKEAWEEGFEEGFKEGFEEGLEEVKVIVAKNLLLEGSTAEFVRDVTGLSLEKISEL
jgi:predicted transposase/invertase (TIGR01784 family)